MAAAIPAYPSVLTHAEWTKKKGLIAKIVAEPTKLGEAFKEAEKDYKAVPWGIMFTPPAATSTMEQIDQHILKTQTDFKTRYGILKDDLDAIKEQGTKVSGDWSKNKLIPKDAKTHLDNVIKGAAAWKTKLDVDVKAAMGVIAEVRRKKEASDPKAAAAHKKDVGDPTKAQAGSKELKLNFRKPASAAGAAKPSAAGAAGGGAAAAAKPGGAGAGGGS